MTLFNPKKSKNENSKDALLLFEEENYLRKREYFFPFS
jgi:hypothetical protein